MTNRKKPGKNSRQLGNTKPIIPTPSWAQDPPPSPFLFAGRDIGIDLSVPRSQSSEADPASNAMAGDTGGQPTQPTQPATSAKATASTTTNNKAQTSKDHAVTSTKNSAAPVSKDNPGPATEKKPAASKGAGVNPEKPKMSNTGKLRNVTPSKQTHEEAAPETSFYSNDNNEGKGVFDSDDDSAPYTQNGSAHPTEHDKDEDDLLKQEFEYGLRDDDEEDEYSDHYGGDDYHFKKHRY